MIPRLVLDASVALTWFLNATEKQTRYADAIAALIIGRESVIVETLHHDALQALTMHQVQ